jgi:hypothetical protein
MAKAISFHTNWRVSRYVPCHLIAICSIASARLPWAPESRGIPAADPLESFQCVHFCVQGTGSHPAVQGDGETWEIPGRLVLPVVLTWVDGTRSPPFPKLLTAICFMKIKGMTECRTAWTSWRMTGVIVRRPITFRLTFPGSQTIVSADFGDAEE